ncbi:quinone-dependent dihydroorotate dehydrogenase [Aestuariispira insulae]|uniref:Dihydroorotate dehydrogenase (quinone) n=1 Tax=Aestuariispira insulae TaxID=1461337 RepID=A0A3D9HFK6_9PROT|nr:quinone-dependent dihydroorotate dehydrogenase [Aestuariispira insulae]RED48031.1 dihydroorotate oxidase A [Aestuariispira insulae]
MSLASLALPLLRCLDPETAHNLTLKALKLGLGPKDTGNDDPVLETTLWNRRFPNPIGLSAGFDKNAEVTAAMLATGMGFVEVGSITPKAQPGNPKPRIFRLPDDGGVINRLGFNNLGMDEAAKNLAKRHNGIIGVNLGKNKTSEDAAADYAMGTRKLAPFADYLVINVSSPNTPGLRALQDPSELIGLIQAVRRERDAVARERNLPVLVKIAPDLNDEDVAEICNLALEQALDGMIVSNTTIARPESLHHQDVARETGGLSGKPVFGPSTEMLRKVYIGTEGKIPLIGVGGVASGRDAYEKIRAGASLVQLYTALVFHGPALIPAIKRELAECLKRDGFASVQEAVGADHAKASVKES